MVIRPPQRFSYPIEDNVVKDDTRCLDCLFDGDVWLSGLDVDIRCLCCAEVDDVSCGNVIHDDAEVDNNVCITDGDVELRCGVVAL